MPLSSNDFLKGVDFTGVNPINAGDFNNLVDLSQPYSDGATEGKSINVWTVDTAASVPDVPNPGAVVKWKRYIWIRVPFAGATDKTPKIYGWNDDAVSDAILLKWQQLIPDTAEFQSQIDALIAQINAFNATVNGAIASANAAATTANLAFNTATAAQTDADNAQTTATQSATDAANAKQSATQALTTANSALTAANANKTIAQITPGTAGQKIRTNVDASSNEYFDEINNYVKVSEVKAQNTDCGNSLNGANVRSINQEDFDSGNLCVVAANRFTLKAGIYKIYAACPGTGTNFQHQAFLIKHSDNSKLIKGTSENVTSGAINSSKSIITGVVTLAVDTELRIDHYFSIATATGFGLGRAANFDQEVYTIVECWKLN